MANWFEDNPLKSIILYTLILITGTWAFYKYTFEESKIDLYKSQIESKQSEISQYQAKIDFLETENSKLEVVVKEFQEWNSKSSNPTLFYKSKFEELASFKKKYEQTLFLKDTTFISPSDSQQIIQPKFPMNIQINKGSTYVNDEEKIVIAVTNVEVTGKCDLIFNVGNKKNEVVADAEIGTVFTFQRDAKKINLTLTKSSFMYDWAEFHITLQ